MLRKFLSAVIVGLGLMCGVLVIPALQAANVSLFTGPAGSNPVNFPAVLSDINKLINSINTTLAPAGTGNMADFIGLNSTVGVVQFTNSGSFTATTSSCTGGAGLTNTPQCLIIRNSSGVTRYIPVF